jgi:RNA polymerase sigma-70 factor, ECF subfamily
MQAEVRELVGLARDGDRDAFEVLVRGASGRLYAIAYRILRDADLAADALQEALVQIWDDLPALRDAERFDAWTYRVVCRRCVRVAKRERRRAVLPLAESMVEGAGSSSATGFETGVAERDEMERAFARLSADHRAVLVLHHYLELTLGEIGEVLGVPPGTVGSRLHYATRSLRAALESQARASQAWGSTT